MVNFVCVGEWWAASLFFFAPLVDGVFSSFFQLSARGRSGVTYLGTAISKGVLSFLAPSKLETARVSFARNTYLRVVAELRV